MGSVESNAKKSKSERAFGAKLEVIKKHKLSKTFLVDMYKNAYLSRKLDDAEISMKKQSKALINIDGFQKKTSACVI